MKKRIPLEWVKPDSFFYYEGEKYYKVGVDHDGYTIAAKNGHLEGLFHFKRHTIALVETRD